MAENLPNLVKKTVVQIQEVKKKKKKGTLQVKIPEEHKFRNPQQNTSMSNSTTH